MLALEVDARPAFSLYLSTPQSVLVIDNSLV